MRTHVQGNAPLLERKQRERTIGGPIDPEEA
jgi:hypothetical protein